jgi:hypothetical protein
MRYIAVAGSDVETCEALGWRWMAIRPYVLASGDDLDVISSRAVELAGHDDIYVHSRY